MRFLNSLVFAVFLLAGEHAHYYVGADNVLLPDPNMTPGSIDRHVKEANIHQTICKAGYTQTVRSVSEATKREVRLLYGADSIADGEVDHLVPLEIGGDNSVRNLWFEPFSPRPGAHEKDVLENYLHHAVCSGEISLHEAQQRISINWYSAYQQYLLSRN